MKKVDFLYLTQDDILSLDISWDEILERTEMALVEHGRKTLENPPKQGVHSMPNSFIHAMPANLKSMSAVGIKWVAGYPKNREVDMPVTFGLQIMNDYETGAPLALMDCTWTTGVRTAAVSALTAKYCARKDTKVVGIIGAGLQGRMNIEALMQVIPGIEQCRIFDINEEALKSYKKDITEKLGIEVVIAESAKDAFKDADICITATQRLPEPIVKKDWIKKGALGMPLESDRAWTSEAIFSADKFLMDDIRQGKSLQAEHDGPFKDGIPELYSETGEVVAGLIPGRESEDETIIAINIGIACEDISFGKYIYELAVEKGVGLKLFL